MKVVRDAVSLRAELLGARGIGIRIGLVPTMGALHEGHLSLIRAARASCPVVVMSLFVNPLQFGPGEDLDAYPRDEKVDLEHARREGVDVAFVPSVEQMYPPGSTTRVTVGLLGNVLEGEERPGHFDGVATVVAKLFHIVRPSLAFFGQKDAQQVAVIKRMVRDLDLDISIVVAATVREPDGLALSSRNAYLTGEDRARATVLFRALQVGRDDIAAGRGAEAAERSMWEVITSAEGVLPGYARAVDPDSFEPPGRDGPVLLAVAATVGRARLIDNLLVES